LSWQNVRRIIVPMSEWSRKTSAKLKARASAQAIRDEKFVELQRLKRANGDAKWLEVREAVEAECSDLNADMGEQIVKFNMAPMDRLQVWKVGTDRTLHAEFHSDTHQLQWECGKRKGHWNLITTENGVVSFARVQEDAPIAAKEIAAQLLDILLETTV